MGRMTKADWQLVREALNYALDERASYRDAWSGVRDDEGKEVRADCDDFKKRVEVFSKKHFGKPTDVQLRHVQFAAIPTVSIFDLRKNNPPEATPTPQGE